MYKAINYWVLGGFDGAKGPYAAIEDAASWGLDGVELTAGDCIPFDLSASECGKIKDAAARAGVGLRTLATGFYWGCSLASPDAEERRRALDTTRQYITLARNLGAESILVVPGAVDVAWDPSRPVVPYAQVWELATRSLRELLPHAAEAGVNIALENVWNKFLTMPGEMKAFLDQFPERELGVYFDTGNCLIQGYPGHWIELLADRIHAVHIKNFARQDCGGVLHGFGDDLLSGDLDIEAFKADHARYIPGTPVTAEMIPFSRLPDMVLPDAALAADTARKLVAI
jgi:L-ribulose-5-phosphate 3-epimerase